MNVQENVPSPTQSTTSTTPVQRIMPLLYVNQANLKPPTPIPSPSNTGTSAPSGTTIVTAMPQVSSGTDSGTVLITIHFEIALFFFTTIENHTV